MTVLVPPSTEALLDGFIPLRSDGFDFIVLDAQGIDAGFLDVARDQPPTLRFDTTRTTTRTLSGVTVTRADLSEIDVERERLRVQMRLQNGDVKPLGTLMFGQQNQTLSNEANTQTPELFDESFLIAQDLDLTVVGPVGASVKDLVTVLMAPFPDIPIAYEDADDTVTVANPIAFPLGSSRYDALAQCAKLLGAFPPYLDNLRRLRFKRSQLTNDSTVDHVYEAGRRLFDGSIRFTSSAYKAPNRYVVTNGAAENPVAAIYDLPDSAPHSFAQRGRRVVAPVHTVSGLLSVDACFAQAYLDAITDQTAFATTTFAASADPRHDGYDVLALLGVPYLETSWELRCEAGGAHTHTGVALWPS